jgi:hypothetical protein
MIIGMKFQDVAVSMVRDPVDPTRRRLIATFTIWRNKLRRDALEHKKGKKCVVLVLLLAFSRRGSGRPIPTDSNFSQPATISALLPLT